MAFLEPEQELPYRTVGLFFGCFVIRLVLPVLEAYHHHRAGDCAARPAETGEAAAKAACRLERYISIETELVGETRQYRLRSVEPLFEEFQSCLNLSHASSLFLWQTVAVRLGRSLTLGRPLAMLTRTTAHFIRWDDLDIRVGPLRPSSEPKAIVPRPSVSYSSIVRVRSRGRSSKSRSA